jgi:toxin ParE1/3/4
MPDFRITLRARDDLKNIGRYTLKIWGKKQRDIYLRSLDKRFQWLAEHPKAGKHRPDIHEGYHCFPQGSHLVFYTLRDGGIDIIGIPHQDMDTLNYFNP